MVADIGNCVVEEIQKFDVFHMAWLKKGQGSRVVVSEKNIQTIHREAQIIMGSWCSTPPVVVSDAERLASGDDYGKQMNEQSDVVESDAWCTTTSGYKASTTFTWTISDFLNRPENKDEFISSSTFKVSGPNDKRTMWKLKLYPRGDEEDGIVSLFLGNTVENAKEIISFKISVLNERHQREYTRHLTIEDVNELYEDGCRKFGDNIIHRETLITLPHLLPNGNLTIVCDLTVFGHEVILSGSKFPDERLALGDDYGKQMNEQIGKLFCDQKFSDVKISCGEEVFHCHRCILSVRSPVFEAMFQSEMRENLSQEVVIKDIRPDVVREMLHFIYNGATSTETVMDEIGKDLLSAADQYQLELLKNKCEEKLCSSLEVSNSVELLVLADLHHAFKLKNMALRLVAINMDTIVNTDVYKDFARHHPDISVEITKLVMGRAGIKRKRKDD